MFLDGISFRKADLNDVETLFTLLNSAYRGESAREGWTHESDLVGGLRTTPEALREIIGKKNESFLLALSEYNILGCSHIIDEGEELYFGMIAVKPNQQNQKIGSRIIEEIHRMALQNRKSALRLVVIHSRKELIAYYERRGFFITGKSEPFPDEYPAKIPGLMLLEMKKTL